MKKIILIMSAVFMIVCCEAVYAQSDGIYDYEIEGGNAVLKSVSVSDGDYLTIPQYLGGAAVKEIDTGAFYGARNLTVEIPENVTKINDYAFMDCDGLKIKGVADSAAEKYAARFVIEFLSESKKEYRKIQGVTTDNSGMYISYNIKLSGSILGGYAMVNYYDSEGKWLKMDRIPVKNYAEEISASLPRCENAKSAVICIWSDASSCMPISNAVILKF